MNHNDDIREVPRPADAVPDHTVADTLPLPPPESLAAAEPPPSAALFRMPPPVSGVEPTWRTLVGATRSDRSRLSDRVDDSGFQREGLEAMRLRETPAVPLLEYSAGTVAREDGVTPTPPVVPAEALVGPPPQTPESTITLTRVGEELFAWLKTLASAAVYATLIVTFGFQVARVEGQSMAPTLADQDRLIVNKLAYRLGQPQVGDIVMLYYPLNPDKSFVKRVIAEEGDQIRIVDGRVYRNDVPINDDYVPPEFRGHDDWGPEVVPQGYYFVMGDHRNNSSDSRHWRFVPKKYIIGKVQLRWWPLPQARIF